MQTIAIIAADLVAISLLTFVVYFRRHHRRDLVTAFLGVNIGVLAVSLVLGSSTVGAGLGLGLFGVLSIIRLRSDEIAQHEVAYYFGALALGLLAGLSGGISLLSLGLMALIIVGLYVGDHPRLFRRYRSQSVRVDVAYADEDALRSHLETMLGCHVVDLSVKSLDLVNDTTLVEVRYVTGAGSEPLEASPASPAQAARPAIPTRINGVPVSGPRTGQDSPAGVGR